jgi:NAD(P)-dependent dehydrogenase (short-subunit alcohol dehydrogenase family)
MSVAIVTGGSAGLGRALSVELAIRGWTVVTDARHPGGLTTLPTTLDGDGRIIAVPGDITDAAHRAELIATVSDLGRLDLLVHNASTLGPTPLPRLADVSIGDLQAVWRTNIGAPLVFTGALLPALAASRGVLLSITSDASVEHYEGWGLYGASKAGLDHITLTYGAENPQIAAYAVDPGDMRTRMHQDAFPGEDISDRPRPETVVPSLLALVAARPANGRYRAAEFAELVSA